jgi:hypothetical protein
MRFLATLLIAGVLPARSQSRPLTICEVLDRHIRNGSDVDLHALAAGTFEGFWLTDGLDDEPCPGAPSRFLTVPHFMAIATRSAFGVKLTADQENAALALYIRARKAGSRPLSVVISGTLVRKPLILIFRYPYPLFSGHKPSYFGNGFGVQGEVPAAIVPKFIQDVLQ